MIHIITLEEAKNYLRVDSTDDDHLIESILIAAQKLCMDVLRTNRVSVLERDPNAQVAVLYATAYLYEHREDADYRALTLSLRALLFGSRKERF